jgi:hypothetical protein
VLQVFALQHGAQRGAGLGAGSRRGAALLRGRECADWGPARGFYLDTVVAATLRLVEALGELPDGLAWTGPSGATLGTQYQRFAPVRFASVRRRWRCGPRAGC